EQRHARELELVRRSRRRRYGNGEHRTCDCCDARNERDDFWTEVHIPSPSPLRAACKDALHGGYGARRRPRAFARDAVDTKIRIARRRPACAAFIPRTARGAEFAGSPAARSRWTEIFDDESRLILQRL